MTSILAIINARRLWCGGVKYNENNTKITSLKKDNSLLIIDGIISYIGTTEEVISQYNKAVEKIPEVKTITCIGERKRNTGAQIIDCKNKYFVSPGFIDSHVHFLDGGRQLSSPNFEFAQSKAQFIHILREYYNKKYIIEGRDKNHWIFGGGWSESVLGELPTKYWLDEVSNTIPIILFSKDVHSAVYNTAALQQCHIISSNKNFNLKQIEEFKGLIELDSVLQEPTGILRDNAMGSTRKYWPSTDSEESMNEALHLASQYFLERGFTMVFSMSSIRFDNISEIEFLTKMEKLGKLRLRIRSAVKTNEILTLMSEYYSPVINETRKQDGFTLPFRFSSIPLDNGGGYFIMGAVKIFSDGSLSSKTAAMKDPYEKEENNIEKSKLNEISILEEKQCNCGVLSITQEELNESILLIQKYNLQCCIHAIGDRAVHTVNENFITAISLQKELVEKKEFNLKEIKDFQLNPRYRIEHCQHISNITKECQRMFHYGIIASMQPCHLLFDGDYVEKLLGNSRKNKSYIWKSFIKSGVHVTFGSDWMVAPADIIDGLRAAILRVPDIMKNENSHNNNNNNNNNRDEENNNNNNKEEKQNYHSVWNPEECLTMEEALHAYTYEGAYAAFMENYIGSLEVGKWGDVTIFSDDLLDNSTMESSPLFGEKLWWPRGKEPKVLYTIVGGIVEYNRFDTVSQY